MTRLQAVKAYLRIARELDRLNGAAADHISRKDNNWQFEIRWQIRDVARRILRKYDLPLDDPYYHPKRTTPLESSFQPDWVTPPGATIQEILEERNLTVEDFAAQLPSGKQFAESLLLGQVPINYALACRLYKLFGGTKEFWMKREYNFRAGLARLSPEDFRG